MLTSTEDWFMSRGGVKNKNVVYKSKTKQTNKNDEKQNTETLRERKREREGGRGNEKIFICCRKMDLNKNESRGKEVEFY